MNSVIKSDVRPKKERNSSVECYRILAILFVLIIHYNGWLAGIDTGAKALSYNSPHWMFCQVSIEALTLPCVNMFILITGYFGLKIKSRTIIDMLFLLLSIKVPFYLVSVIEAEPFSTSNLVQQFRLISNAGYFVEDYLMLMFFSPVLNSFIEQKGRKILPWVITFALIEFYFEDIVHDEEMQFNRGYSLIHFVLMYFIGRCIWLFKDKLFKIKSEVYILTYFLCSLTTAIILCAGIRTGLFYSSPLAIIAAMSLFIPFLKKNYYNKVTNWVAKSVFCVYIFHTTPPIINIIKTTDQFTLTNYTYSIYWLYGILLIIAIFIAGVVYDKTRLLITNPLTSIITTKVNNILVRYKTD